MTRVDAWTATGVDRKTLAKIDRGEEVKQETLQKLANNLGVPISFFDPPESESPAIRKLTEKDGGEPGNFFDAEIMLREFDAEGLSELLRKAKRVRWHLNLQVVDEKVHELLEQFDKAVYELRRYLTYQSAEWTNPWHSPTGLSKALSGVKKRRVVANLMQRLAEHRITVLGADYLHWDVSKEIDPIDPDSDEVQCVHTYTSTRTLELSIEKSSVRTRRQPINLGSEPPKFIPETDPPTIVFVDGMQLSDDEWSEELDE
jgi:transcriptional regulator with XRE-family HTH domain